MAVDEALETTLKCRKQTPEFQELNSILKLVFNAHEVTKVVGVRSVSRALGLPVSGVLLRTSSASAHKTPPTMTSDMRPAR